MSVELRLLGSDNTSTYVLPDFESLTLSPVLCDAGAIEFSFPKNGINWDKIEGLDEFEVALFLDGVRQPTLDGIIKEMDGDDVAEDAVWKFTGFFNNGRLAEAVTYPAGWPDNVDPQLPNLRFSSHTAGTIVGTLMLQAQQRGTLDDVTFSSFTTQHDSNGVPWDKELTVEYAPQVNYLTILQNLYEQQVCEFQMVGKDLRLYVMGTMSEDLTEAEPPLVFRRGRDLNDSPRKVSSRDVGTVHLAAGSEGLYEEVLDPTQVAARRRIETGSSQGNIADRGTLRAYAEASIAQISRSKMEKTHGLVFADEDTPRPIRHFNVGDWAWSDTGAGLERLRIKQWVIKSESDGSLTGSVSLNDLFAEREAALARRIQGIVGGSTITGGSRAVNRVPDEMVDGMPPAVPMGLALLSSGYLDSNGQTYAQVSAVWAQVSENDDGTILEDLDHYEIQWRHDPSNIPAPVTQGTVSDVVWQGLLGEGWWRVTAVVDDRVLAAREILHRITTGQPIFEDWGWRGDPAVVRAHNDFLVGAFYASGGNNAVAWLQNYIATNTRPDVLYPPNYNDTGYRQVMGTSDNELSWSPIAPGISIWVAVRAVDKAGNASAWSTEQSILTGVDTTPPPVPSLPLVDNYLGLLRIRWDGTFAYAERRPYDFARVDVHVSSVDAFTPTDETRVAPLVSPGSVFIDVPYGDLRYVRLVAYDASENASEPSAVVAGLSQQVVGDDVFDGAIGTAKLADLAVTTAKINSLAVNDAKIGNVSVGKLTAGIMSAEVVMGGRIATALTGSRTEMNSLGFYKFDASDNVLVAIDANGALITGRYRSAISGRRIEMGAAAGTGQIDFIAPDGRRGRLRSFTSSLGDVGTEAIEIGMPIANVWGAWNSLQIGDDEELYASSGAVNITAGGNGPGGRYFRVLWAKDRGTATTSYLNTAEDRFTIGAAHTSMYMSDGVSWGVVRRHADGRLVNRLFINEDEMILSPGTDKGYLAVRPGDANGSTQLRFFNAGGYGGMIKYFGEGNGGVNGRLEIRNWPDTDFMPVHGTAFINSSDAEGKAKISALPGDMSLLTEVRRTRPKLYHRKHENDELGPLEIGLVAQESPSQIVISGGGPGSLGIDQYQMTTYVWGALIEEAERHDKTLERLAKVEARLNALSVPDLAKTQPTPKETK